MADTPLLHEPVAYLIDLRSRCHAENPRISSSSGSRTTRSSSIARSTMVGTSGGRGDAASADRRCVPVSACIATAPTSHSPTDIAAIEARHQVLALLDRLPARQRQVIAWTYYGANLRKFAETLQMTADAARRNLYNARETCGSSPGSGHKHPPANLPNDDFLRR